MVAAAQAARPMDVVPVHIEPKHGQILKIYDAPFVAANGTHYGNPANGCQADEKAVQVQGVTGDFCSPPCSATTPCPTDVPPGTTVKPQCALEVQGSSSPTMCALICIPIEKKGCPTGASCGKVAPLEGLC